MDVLESSGPHSPHYLRLTEQIGGVLVAVDSLTAQQRQTNRTLQEVQRDLGKTTEAAEETKERVGHIEKKMMKTNGNGNGNGNGRGWSKTTIIALISLCLMFLGTVVGAAWYLGGEVTALKTAVSPPVVSSAGAPVIRNTPGG